MISSSSKILFALGLTLSVAGCATGVGDPSPGPSEPSTQTPGPSGGGTTQKRETPATNNALPSGGHLSSPPSTKPALDVPQSLIDALDQKTYVEESCQSTTYPGWPHAAQKCTYHDGLEVTIANPTAERVATWIVEASQLIPALDGLHTRDRANWEAGLLKIAKHTLGQSSRIFALSGKVWEDGTAYTFERGVTKTCSSGCYCRVNSTSRQQWCAYASQVLGTETESACLSKYGATSSTLTEDWMQHCFDNHAASFDADANQHYRAQAWAANEAISGQFPNPATANGADVVAALSDAYPLY